MHDTTLSLMQQATSSDEYTSPIAQSNIMNVSLTITSRYSFLILLLARSTKSFFFFLKNPAPPEISPLSQHAALPIPWREAPSRKRQPRREAGTQSHGSGHEPDSRVTERGWGRDVFEAARHAQPWDRHYARDPCPRILVRALGIPQRGADHRSRSHAGEFRDAWQDPPRGGRNDAHGGG